MRLDDSRFPSLAVFGAIFDHDGELAHYNMTAGDEIVGYTNPKRIGQVCEYVS